MDDIEDFSLFGINIGGGKKQNLPQNNEATVGLLSGMIMGLSLSQAISAWASIDYQKEVENIIKDISTKRDLQEKMLRIKQRIDSNNDVDIYGGILILFSELEKTVDLLYRKFVRSYSLPDTFRDKVTGLESKRIVTSVEANILRNEIYPKRNMISHGRYSAVERKEVGACYDFVSQFIIKYDSMTH